MHRALNFFITAIIGGLTVLFFIGIRFGEPPWMQDSRLVIMGTAMAFAFVVGLAIVKSNLFPATNFFAHLLRAAAIASMTCLPVLVWVRYSDSQAQKLTIIIEVGIVFFLLIINGLGLSNRIAMGISLVVFAVGIHTGFTDVARSSFIQLIQSTNTEFDKASNARKFIFTPLHDVQVVNGGNSGDTTAAGRARLWRGLPSQNNLTEIPEMIQVF